MNVLKFCFKLYSQKKIIYSYQIKFVELIKTNKCVKKITRKLNDVREKDDKLSNDIVQYPMFHVNWVWNEFVCDD